MGSDSDHPAGHDGAGGLRRLPELHPQPVFRVGEVQRVRRLPEQTQSGQETSQPAGDGALLLQCEDRTSLPAPGRRTFVYSYRFLFFPVLGQIGLSLICKVLKGGCF